MARPTGLVEVFVTDRPCFHRFEQCDEMIDVGVDQWCVLGEHGRQALFESSKLFRMPVVLHR